MRLLSLLFTAVAVVLAPVIAAENAKEKFAFQSETSRLMDILINSLYTNKDVFLRELISNANDALDKIRFLAMTQPEVLDEGGEDLEIRVELNREKKTLWIRDTGIGMTKADLINNLGTVAKSGTTQFVEALQKSGDLNLIGQFGVGFYSAFLVADRVIVQSKHNDDPVQHVWESTADSSFVVYDDPEGNTLKRGTKITLLLKEDAPAYIEQEHIKGLIRKFSEFINFPIYFYASKTEVVEDEEATKAAEEEEAKKEAEEAEKKKAEREAKIAAGEPVEDEPEETEEQKKEKEEKKKKNKKMKTKQVENFTWERMNPQPAIWTRPASEITAQEYKDFYKTVTKDYQYPLSWTHFKAEGEIEFRSILYIPGRITADSDHTYSRTTAIKLYVRRVLIQDTNEDLMPRYLRFVRGVVDSDDLALQVSRETIQQGKIFDVIRKKLVRKVLDEIRSMVNKPIPENYYDEIESSPVDEEGKEKPKKVREATMYEEFWRVFGKNIKLGVMEDPVHRNKLIKLLRFYSTYSTKDGEDKFTSFEEYVSRMPEWQKNIYFISAEDLESAKQSPFLHRAKEKGVEVLLMTDPTDEYILHHSPDYEGRKIISLSKEGVEFGDENEKDKVREKMYKTMFKPLSEYMSKVLGERVEKVVVNPKVGEIPSLLVTSQFGFTAHQEKLAKAQMFGDLKKMPHLKARRVMEINPIHPIIARLKEDLDAGIKSTSNDDIILGLYDAAAVSSGFDIDDVRGFNKRMSRLIKSGLDLPTLSLVPEIDPEEEEEKVNEQKEERESVEL